MFIEDKSVAIDRTIEHLLCHILYLGLAEIVEDEMVLKTPQQECHLLVFFLLLLKVEFLLVVDLVHGLVALTVLSLWIFVRIRLRLIRFFHCRCPFKEIVFKYYTGKPI